jgi:hypothetical protein
VNPDRSLAELARATGWTWQSGEPAKSKVERVLARLKAARLVKDKRGRFVPTEEGKEVAAKESQDAPKGSAKFQPIIDKHLDGVECVHCGREHDVFKIRDGRGKNGKAEALHKACAEAWFGGDF